MGWLGAKKNAREPVCISTGNIDICIIEGLRK